MRTLVHVAALLVLFLGLAGAGFYACFLLSVFLLGVFDTKLPSWAVYATALPAWIAWVGYRTLRGIVAALRGGPPPAFKGWRYAAAAASVAMFVPAWLAVFAPPGPLKSFVPPGLAFVVHVVAVLLAIAAVPPREG